MNYDIEKLLKIKHSLEDATTKLNLAILEFEADLKKIAMGVPLSIKISDTVYLSYGKCKGDWRLMATYHDAGDDHEVTVPLVEATRPIRLHGYKHRMELLPALEKTAESLARRMRIAVGEDHVETVAEEDPSARADL